MDIIQDFLNTIVSRQDIKPSDIVVPTSAPNANSRYLSHYQDIL